MSSSVHCSAGPVEPSAESERDKDTNKWCGCVLMETMMFVCYHTWCKIPLAWLCSLSNLCHHKTANFLSIVYDSIMWIVLAYPLVFFIRQRDDSSEAISSTNLSACDQGSIE